MKPKRTKKAPESETKEQKFLRLAVARVNRAIKAIRSVSKLASRSYEHTPEQAERILKAIGEEVKALELAFQSPEGKPVEEFTL